MRKEKKIALYLERHPRVTVHQLQHKFDLGRQEALTLLGQVSGSEEASGYFRTFSNQLRLWFHDEKKTLGTLFGLALFVRLPYGLAVLRDPLLSVPLHDAKYYLLWARDILAHGWIGDSVFFTEPFYAYLLALFLKIFGSGGPTALLVFQWFLGALLPVGLYLVTKKLLNRQAALVTGVLAALYGPFVFYEGLLLKTSLEVALLPWFLLTVFWAFEKRRTLPFFLLGLFLGGLSLVKGNNLIFAPVIVGLILFLLRGNSLVKRALLTGAFTLGVVLLILPVTIRNYVVGEDLVLTNYSFGLVVYQGSWWGGDGSTALVPPFLRPDPAYEETDAVGMAQAYAGRDLKPSEVSSFWVEKARQEILADPLRFAGVLWNKVLILLNHSEFSDNYQFVWFRSQVFLLWLLPNFFFVGFFGLLGAGLFFLGHFWRTIRGLPAGVRSPLRPDDRAIIVMTLFLSSVAVLLLTTVNARYRVPLIPFFLIFSGGALAYIWTCLKESESIRLLALGAGGFAALLLLVYPLPLLRFDTAAQSYHALGYEELRAGRYPEASRLFEQTITTDPEYAWAYGNLALSALAQGKDDEAAAALKKLIVLRPDDLSNYRHLALWRDLKGASPEERIRRVEESVQGSALPDYDTDFNEAERYRSEGDTKQAETFYQLSLKRFPDAPATQIALSALYRQSERLAEAKALLKHTVEKHPEIFVARYNLANIYIQENNFAPVADLLLDIYDFAPELGETWYNYAVALIKLDRTTEAVPVMQAYIDRYQDDPARETVVEKFRSALKPAQGNSLDTLLPNQSGKTGP